MKPIYSVYTGILLIVLSGCSSSVQRPDDAGGYVYNLEKYNTVELTVSDTATKDPNDRVRFDENALQEIIRKKLEVGGLIDESSLKSVRVEINDIRVRSSFNAFMWGFMAGNDHIRGEVSLIGDDGVPFHSFQVSASYALGGLAGMNETRMSWLYEEFSKLVHEEISGNKATAMR